MNDVAAQLDLLGDLVPEEAEPQPVTLQDWRRFVDADPVEFELVDRSGLDGQQLAAYNRSRIAYHSHLVVVGTSAVQRILLEGRLLTILNQKERSARQGLFLSGQQTTGKSTGLMQLGRTVDLLDRRMHPGDHRIPVVYINLPPVRSPLKLAAAFAHFLGLPVSRRMTDNGGLLLVDAVCRVLVDGGCQLVLIDEVHNLNNATVFGEDMSDHLKRFWDHVPATFVYAGIDVPTCGVFSGIRGRQIAGRCGLLTTGPFPFNDEWKALVASFEQALRLYAHEPGALVRLSRYLHRRTGGSISSLSVLIRGAAQRSIIFGTEKITVKLMDAMPLDIIATKASAGSGGAAD